MINILLNGSKGKMGTTLTSYIGSSSKFNLLYEIDSDNCYLFDEIKTKPDVIIDFSTPESTLVALNYAVKNLIPIVIATTGFSEEQERQILEYSEAIPIFKSANMSYGITLFANTATELAKKLESYNIEIVEKHHRRKKDAPSGTALMIADKINKKCNNKYTYVFNRCTKATDSSNLENNNKRMNNSNEIGFSSIRGGNLIGEHSVLFFGENETIEITHTAYSRNIYIIGALNAAEFVITKKNGIYDMNDLLLK